MVHIASHRRVFHVKPCDDVRTNYLNYLLCRYSVLLAIATGFFFFLETQKKKYPEKNVIDNLKFIQILQLQLSFHFLTFTRNCLISYTNNLHLSATHHIECSSSEQQNHTDSEKPLEVWP
jgi:hypothetical protein